MAEPIWRSSRFGESYHSYRAGLRPSIPSTEALPDSNQIPTETVATTHPDIQNQRPALHMSLSRVGVTGVEKVIRIRHNDHEQLFHANLECFVDLGPNQKGAHMSRFEEVVNEAIGAHVLGEARSRPRRWPSTSPRTSVTASAPRAPR